MTAPLLLDNTVLTNFAVVGRPDLAIRLWPESLRITAAVRDEYAEGVVTRSLPAEAWSAIPVIDPTTAEMETAAGLPGNLGPGERTSLAVAIHRSGGIATDDRDARDVAQQYKVPVTGTIGILLRSVREAALPLAEANALLTRMIAANYRSPVATLDALLSSAS